MATTPVFVHHTLQYGYPLYPTLGEYLGEPVGRYRTVERFPLVVPLAATCANPACGFDHRVCGLLHRPGEGHRVEGDLFELDDEQLRELDAVEYYDPTWPDEAQGSFRRPVVVEPVTGGAGVEAQAHFNDNAADRYRDLVARGLAEVVPVYTLAMAAQVPKACCVNDPGHDGPHGVRTDADG